MVIVVPIITEEDTITDDAASESSVIATSNADIYNAGIESDSDTVHMVRLKRNVALTRELL